MRIDAARGRIAGASPGRRTPLITSQPEQLADGLAAVAGALRQREEAAAQAEAERQEGADRLTLAQGSAAFRERMTAEFDADANEYDGSSPGFADRWKTRLDAEIDREIETVDPRLADAARLRLNGVRDNFALAAVSLENSRREAHLLNGIGETINTEALAVQRDAGSLALARDNVDMVMEAAPAALRGKLKDEAYGRLANAALTSFEGDNPRRGLAALDGGDFDDMLDAEAQSSWRARLNREIDRRDREAERAQEKAQRQAASLVSEEVKDITRLRKLGLPVSDERYDRLERVAASAGPETLVEVREARAAGRTAEEVGKLPYLNAVAGVQSMRAALAGKGDVARGDAMMLEAAEAALEGMGKAMGGDLLSFAASHRGGIDELDFADPVAALKTRAAQAQEAADYYGAPKTRYFTDNELDSLKAKLDADPSTRGLFIDAVAAAGAPQMLQEIAPKAPAIAHAAGLAAMGGDRQFIADALRGQDLKAKGDLPSTVKNAAGHAPMSQADVLGGAFALRPEAKSRVIETAGLAYDAWSNDKSRTLDQFDAKDYERALQHAAGAVGEGREMRGGIATISHRGKARRVWAPSWMRNRDFQRTWTGMSDADWKAGNAAPAYNADGKVIPLAELRKATPVAVDNGVYILDFSRDGSRLDWPVDENGAPWRFDLNKVRAQKLSQETGD